MKHVILGLLLIMTADSARVEAHAFLQRAEPAVGSTVQSIAQGSSDLIYGKDRTSLEHGPGVRRVRQRSGPTRCASGSLEPRVAARFSAAA